MSNASVRFTKCAAIFIAALLDTTTRKFLCSATSGEAVYQRDDVAVISRRHSLNVLGDVLPWANAVCLLGVPAIALGTAQSELLRMKLSSGVSAIAL